MKKDLIKDIKEIILEKWRLSKESISKNQYFEENIKYYIEVFYDYEKMDLYLTSTESLESFNMPIYHLGSITNKELDKGIPIENNLFFIKTNLRKFLGKKLTK